MLHIIVNYMMLWPLKTAMSQVTLFLVRAHSTYKQLTNRISDKVKPMKTLSNTEIEPKNETENETLAANMLLAFAGASTSVDI